MGVAGWPDRNRTERYASRVTVWTVVGALAFGVGGAVAVGSQLAAREVKPLWLVAHVWVFGGFVGALVRYRTASPAETGEYGDGFDEEAQQYMAYAVDGTERVQSMAADVERLRAAGSSGPAVAIDTRRWTRFQRSKRDPFLSDGGSLRWTMTGTLPSFVGLLGAVLASIGVAAAMIFAGINPILGVLAGSVLVLDVIYYQRRRSVDTDAAMQELVSGRTAGAQHGSTRDSRQ